MLGERSKILQALKCCDLVQRLLQCTITEPRHMRWALFHGILPIIPPKITRREPAPCDFRRYRDRNRIERMFNRLKQFRRIATRYHKTEPWITNGKPNFPS